MEKMKSGNRRAEEVKPEGFAFWNWQDWLFTTFFVFLELALRTQPLLFRQAVNTVIIWSKCQQQWQNASRQRRLWLMDIKRLLKVSISSLALASGMSSLSDVFWSEALWLPQSRRCYLNLYFLYSSLAEVSRRGRARGASGRCQTSVSVTVSAAR